MADKPMETKGFTKVHTQIAKGIAILLMVYHHLFVLPERLGYNYISVINMTGFDLQSYIANFAKICVNIFVFCSGIGLYYSLIKMESLKAMYKKVIFQGLKFLTNYWIILLFLFPIGVGLGFFELSVGTIIKIGVATYAGVGEWWFVKLYICLILVAPLLVRLFQDISISKKIIPFVGAFSALILVKVVARFLSPELGPVYKAIKFYVNIIDLKCVLVFIVAMLCVKFNAIELYQKFEGGMKSLICLISLAIAIEIRVIFSNSPTSMDVDFIVVPLFILPIVTLLENTKGAGVLGFFAKHSTNIWLTHTFWCYYYGQEIVLLPRYSILIYLWLLVLALISSYIINIVYIPINNLIFGKEHKLSFAGYLYRKSAKPSK